MPFVQTPTDWVAAISADATDLTIPIASVPELTAAEAHGTTGDIRKIIYALCEKFWSRWNALATADKPTKMILAKSVSVDAATGVVTNSYTFTFKNSITAQEVVAEA